MEEPFPEKSVSGKDPDYVYEWIKPTYLILKARKSNLEQTKGVVMGTLIVLFVCSLIVPLTMLGFGVWMRRRPPKEINGVIGYRTRMSMKNEQTWRFAQEKCGKIWTWVGAIFAVISAVLSILLWRNSPDTLTRFASSFMMAQVVVLLATIVPVEHALKKHFDENGNPKE